MEDAYEIGIRLVLENGVSAGIAALQSELATYDRALTATTGRLQTATEVGRRFTAPMGSGGGVPAVRSPVAGELTEASDAETGRRREAPVPVPTMSPRITVPPQVAVVLAPARIRATPPERDSGVQERTLRLPVAPELPARATTQTPQSALRLGREPAMPARPVPAAPAVKAVPAVMAAPVVPAAPLVSAAPVVPAPQAMAVPPPSYAHYAPVSPVDRAPAVVVQQVPDSGLASRPVVDRREGQQAPVPARELVRPFEWSMTQPGEGFASAGAPPPRPPRPEGASIAATEPASPVAAATPSGPTQGDVYLDGTRVGRWMSDRLARDVNRPQAGVTGFDPRLGPTWPGSLHGT